MQPFQCDLQAQIPKHPITTHTQAHPKQLEATVTMRQKKRQTPQPHPPHRQGTFHRRLQPLYTEKHKVSFRLPPQLTTSLPHRFPSSPHFPSSPPPFVTTSLRHHFPSSPPRHCHHPSSRSIPPLLILVLCIVTHRHHLPSSPLPFVTTPSLSPPFIKVNSTASYSCVMYCYVMHCYVIYHPSSRSIPPLHCPSSRSIPPLLLLVLCIVMLCIVM